MIFKQKRSVKTNPNKDKTFFQALEYNIELKLSDYFEKSIQTVA